LIDRVRDRRTFARLRRAGVKVRTDPLWCWFVDDQMVRPPQVAFALNRALGNAVTRNRLRRRLRSILNDIDVPPGIFLIGATRDACELTYVELKVTTTALVAGAVKRAARRVT
jgi:ribonuclease P protein component